LELKISVLQNTYYNNLKLINLIQKSKYEKDFEKFLTTVELKDYFLQPVTLEEFLSIPDYWLPEIQELIKGLLELGWNGELHQVKVKFDELRFYIGTGTLEMYNLIKEYEEKLKFKD
jgi:hypothetical protein